MPDRLDPDATRELLFAEFGENSLDVPCTPNPSAVGDGLYIGNSAPFDYVDLWVNQAGAGTYTITWKYYNGTSWLPLTLTGFGDRSNSWKRPGRHTIMFTRPELGDQFNLTYTLYQVKAGFGLYQPNLQPVWAGFGSAHFKETKMTCKYSKKSNRNIKM